MKRVILAALVVLLVAASGCSRQNPAAPSPWPWTTYEAEDGRIQGTVVGPSLVYRTPESESSGRRHVRLEKLGDFVEFTVRQAADGLVLRYSLPDAPKGDGLSSTLSLYVNGKFAQTLRLTSRNAWSYGDFPWSNDPAQGRAHHFFDEMRARIPGVLPGDVVRVQRDAGDATEYCLLDFVELEAVAPPLPRPAGSVSLVEFGAVADDELDDSPAFLQCLAAAAARGKVIWVPPGDFRLDGKRIPLPRVEVRGAGMWHSQLSGSAPMFAGQGEAVTFSDLAITGDTNHRNDNSPDNAFDGSFGEGSVFRHLWIEHVKCGFWTAHGTRHMRVERCRIRNVMADGLNFCDGTSDSVVEQCHLRNTGDDALATWSANFPGSSHKPCRRNAFVGNLIQLPWHANGLAIYGGGDHRVVSNTVAETVFSGAGLLISSGFEAVPFCGPIRAEHNVFHGTGGDCYIGEPVGALWIHAKDSDITVPIEVHGLVVTGAPRAAISVHGPKGVNRLRLQGVRIDGTGDPALHVHPGVRGHVHLADWSVTNSPPEIVRNENAPAFVVELER